MVRTAIKVRDALVPAQHQTRAVRMNQMRVIEGQRVIGPVMWQMNVAVKLQSLVNGGSTARMN